MQTGCVPCLIDGIRCDPNNPNCRMAIAAEWNLNRSDRDDDEQGGSGSLSLSDSATSLTLFQPDTKWQRSWRERHSLNFFVQFSAPQMSGFFDSIFWQRMIIQMSFREPAILHAITAMGALHEANMQRAFTDENRQAQSTEFALRQCNKAIACLTTANLQASTPDAKLALTTCILFTCFEAMQGRVDSAVNHALQGRRLLQMVGRANVSTMDPHEADDVEQMRPMIERLEVQATALLEQGKRMRVTLSDRIAPLPPIDLIHSINHAETTLHTAMNSVMRCMQAFRPTAFSDHSTVTLAHQRLGYSSWFSHWEQAFSSFLIAKRQTMSHVDLKRAMVLKANHLVVAIVAAVDTSAGPTAYNTFQSEFQAIVDLAHEVLASYPCPPLPTLCGGSAGTPYLSFSLWVTDPLWMVVSRCCTPSIRQAAFALLSQNPRQEGIWHSGPALSHGQTMRREETSPSRSKNTVGANSAKQLDRSTSELGDGGDGVDSIDGGNSRGYRGEEAPGEVQKAEYCANMRERSAWLERKASPSRVSCLSTCPKVPYYSASRTDRLRRFVDERHAVGTETLASSLSRDRSTETCRRALCCTSVKDDDRQGLSPILESTLSSMASIAVQWRDEALQSATRCTFALLVTQCGLCRQPRGANNPGSPLQHKSCLRRRLDLFRDSIARSRRRT